MKKMDLKSLTQLITEIAGGCGVDANLALAIASQESGFDPHAIRYEESWSYLMTPHLFAAALGITETTESALQRMSWNCLQVMGAVCRELGYNGNLLMLTDPEQGIYYGCLKLKQLKTKYSDEQNVIAAYNAGSPGKVNGRYKNQNYVSAVLKNLNHLRQLN